jgi:predicted AlkP superfamily pyrophosphatase or phosphodiesterase
MDCCDASMHIGPQRGDSIAGDAGSKWRMNIDGYEGSTHIGGQSSINLPTGTWVRVRVWQVDKGANWSKWGVWALWSGTDHPLGSLTLDGVYMSASMLAEELYEASNQCTTDFVGVYLDNPRYRSASQGLRSFGSATANYEANCSNTSWKVISAPDYIHDVREAARTIPHGGIIWN